MSHGKIEWDNRKGDAVRTEEIPESLIMQLNYNYI